MEENQQMEWKRSWRDDYLKWVCGFANADGGVLVVGRDDKGRAVGVADADELLEHIPNKARDLLGIMVDVNLVRDAGKELVEIAVELSTNPVSYRGRYYYRSGSTNQELKGAALDNFLLRKQGRHWDGEPVPRVKASELDKSILGGFREEARKSQRLTPELLRESDVRLLEKLHLRESSRLKRAAVLLFHPDPEKHVTGAWIKMGYFLSDADLRYQDEVHGGLLFQVNQVLEILRAKYMKAYISYEGLQRIETYPVPDAALREALTNAVVHKDYARGAPIQIRVYRDKIMICNPGQLPQGWTIDRLLGKHSSEPFNPNIANTFFRAGMIEAWGRGIERIREACEQDGVPVPHYETQAGDLWVTFNFSEDYLLEIEREEADSGTDADVDVGINEGVNVGINEDANGLGKGLGKDADIDVGINEEINVGINEGINVGINEDANGGKKTAKTRLNILAAIQADPEITTIALAEKAGVDPRTVERHIKQLRESGHIERVGSRKKGHWKVLTKPAPDA